MHRPKRNKANAEGTRGHSGGKYEIENTVFEFISKSLEFDLYFEFDPETYGSLRP